LKTANRLRRTMQDLQAQLDALDNISPEEQEDFKRREGEIAEPRSAGTISCGDWAASTPKAPICKPVGQDQDGDKPQADRAGKGEINSRRIARARQAQQLFDDYKKRLKDSRREDIERQINLRFKSLMSSHGQDRPHHHRCRFCADLSERGWPEGRHGEYFCGDETADGTRPSMGSQRFYWEFSASDL
jgi:hypothetical protein